MTTEVLHAQDGGAHVLRYRGEVRYPATPAVARFVREMIDRDLPARVVEKGAVLRRRLEERFGQHPNVGDIRGRGLFMGIELVADRDTKAPFDPKLGVNKTIKKAAFEAGLICYPMGGTIDGRSGDHVLLAPPFIIEDAQIDELVDKLAIGIDAAIPVS